MRNILGCIGEIRQSDQKRGEEGQKGGDKAQRCDKGQSGSNK